MQLTTAEYYTYQFYTWDYRGRGWFLAGEPIELEPPFIPFVRHAPQSSITDDGKRHTLISWLIGWVKGTREPPEAESPAFDYETIEPFVQETADDLCVLQVRFPKERKITPERMRALLIMLSSSSALISYEIIGTAQAIIIQFACRHPDAGGIEAHASAYFPEAVIVRDDLYRDLIEPNVPASVIDFGLRDEFIRPLDTSKTFTVDLLTGIFAVLNRLGGVERGGIQILFSGTVNSWGESIMHSAIMPDGSSFFADAPESPKLALEKTNSPLCAVTIRAFSQGENADGSARILSQVSHALMLASQSPFNALIPLPHPEYDFDTRVDDLLLRQSHRLGMLLNADELVNLLHFPSEEIEVEKLFKQARKTKVLPGIAKNKELILGTNTHHGVTAAASYGVAERMKHTYVIGGTGTGKSTLLLSLIVQDIVKGNGVAVLDPHGDLIETILTYIPESRISDVVIVDPSDSDYPVAFNMLFAHSEVEKEVLSSDMVAAFKRLSTSWGDQMHSIFSNAVLAFLESTTGGTLADLRRFLIEPSFRAAILKTVSDPHIQYYWHKEYPLLKTNSIGPILTRLDTFLRPKLIRNMVCQNRSLDFESILDTQKIMLIKLPQGLIGIENSYLLGTLIVAKIHQAALARQAKTLRKEFYLYIDEFQHFVTPSMESIISGTRKYQLGLVLAHQDMQQLAKNDSDLASAIIGNIGTRICFRVGDNDAKHLAEGFSFFEAEDLQNLDTGQAIVRMERRENDFSLDTIRLPASPTAPELKDAVIAYSRERYATGRDSVEKELSAGLYISEPSAPEHIPPPKEKEKGDEEVSSVKHIPEEKPVRLEPEAVQKTVANIAGKKEESQHRYLQTLIKKMAESRGYKATIEAGTPDGKGKVDVLLEKDDTQIACEVSVTTDAEWELHNIQKCLAAGYGTVICCLGDAKGILKLRRKIQETLSTVDQQKVKVLQPEALFSSLDSIAIAEVPTETTFKGYRVKVSYDAVSDAEMKGKRDSVAKIVADSLRKMKK
ncbi:MAG: type IV secretion system DNA-binding domain-containing protein [Bacteroidota bacterium]